MIWKFENVFYIYIVKPPIYEPDVPHDLSIEQLRQANQVG